MGRRATAGRFDPETEERDMGLAENMDADFQEQADARAAEETASRVCLAVELRAVLVTLANVHALAAELGYGWLETWATEQHAAADEHLHRLATGTTPPKQARCPDAGI
jgi:hypothetical protein